MGKIVLYDLNEDPEDTARAYGTKIPLKARCTFHAWVEAIGAGKPRILAKFHVVDNGERSILGRITATRMKLLKVGIEVNSLIEPPAEMQEFPSIPGLVIDFDIDASVTPTKNAYVNIPAAYKEKALARLRVMAAQGIIERLTKPPKWINGMSAVPKGKDDFRLVVNMVGPNKAIRREYYKMPTIEEIRVRLHGAVYYTKLDITSAYYHIVLGEESRELTTFLSPDGMYRFIRMVFGVNSAPETFQRVMEDILRAVTNVIIYIDDVLVFAKTLQDLRKYTKAVLAALKKNNLTLNESKCEYEKTDLEFLGHEISSAGLNITKKKVEDVRKFRAPRCTAELKSFLGLSTFLSGYIKDFATKSEPLWAAAKSKDFYWGVEQHGAFAALKQEIIDCTVSQGFFSNEDDTYIYTDASPVALGAVLVQVNPEGHARVISFASKLLSATERRYAQTQREALAIVWGTEHFWYYLLGRKFTIRTDALGISFILKKERAQTKRIMSRAEGWCLRLSRFDFEVEFVEGKFNIADPSSRLLEGIGESFEEAALPGEIMQIAIQAPDDMKLNDICLTLEEVRYHTERDTMMQEAFAAVESGEWTSDRNQLKEIKNELRVQEGILTKLGIIVMPEALRPKTLSMAHRGHPGISSMKSLLRGSVWWPGMMAQAEHWVKSCEACTLTSRRQPPMPMQRSVLPEAPWEELACDFSGPYKNLGGIYILLIVDSYSRYLIARPVRSTNFNSTCAVFHDIFDTFGYVRTIKSDNGPPFNGAEYKQYMNLRGIKLVFSTPADAQQNGRAETYMKMVNKAMAVPSVEGGSYQKALVEAVTAHNSAVCGTTGVAPDELMFGRRLRRSLPLVRTAANAHTDSEIRRKDWRSKMSTKEREDKKRGARYSDIEVGDKVYVIRSCRNKGETRFDPTVFTVIVKKHGMLELLSPDGVILKRTVTFVKKITDREAEFETVKNGEAGATVINETGDGEDHVLDGLEPAEETEVEATAINETGRGEDSALDGTQPVQINPRRSKRVIKQPAYLQQYVRLVEDCALEEI